MNRLALIILTSCALLAPIRATWPQTTPPGVNPEIPPGTETPQGDILLQGDAPQPLVPEIQPGSETPRGAEGGVALGTGPLPGTRNSGDEDDIEDLEVERLTVEGGGMLQDATVGGGPLLGTRNSGDEDEFEDLDIERHTVQGGGLLQDAPGLNPAPVSPGIPGQPASGGLDLPAVGMKPKDAGGAGGGEPQPTAKTPRFKAGKALKDSIQLTGEPTRRENCGTVLTGLIDDPDSDVNPCPTGCERGEQLWVKTYKSGDTTQYEASYQCYMPAVPTLSMPADAPSSGENCGTYWTGWMDTLDTGVNPCPQGCLRGQKPTVKTGLSGHGIKYDVNYQCYMPEIPTLSMPADAPSSGENCGTYWTGWMDTLDTAVNPCPQNCVRGQKPTVKTGLSGHGIKYDVNYQCYTATTTTTMAADARTPKPITDAAAAPQQMPARGAGGGAALEPSTKNIDAPIASEVQAAGAAPQGVSVVGGDEAASQDLTSLTQPFALAADESTGWPLIIGQTGPIDIQVDAQGAALVLTLTHPGGNGDEQSGSGSLRLQADATPTDLAQGQIWTVRLRPANPAVRRIARPSQATGDPKVIASGTITVSHPPGDASRAQGELAQRTQAIGSEGAVNSIAAIRVGNAELQILEGSRAGVIERQMQQRAGLREQFDLAAQQPVLPPSGAVTPRITDVSISEGSPGDAVLIKGIGFGAAQGSVTFSVEPNSALAAPIVVWSDTAILVSVPDVSGMRESYSGKLRVNGAATLDAPFRFIPALETRILVPSMTEVSIGSPSALEGNICHPACRMGFSTELFIGHRGEDTFFRGRTLRNGWKVVSTYLAHVSGNDDLQGVWTENNANAYVTDVSVGTELPYVKVHWWNDAFGSVAYVPRVVIRGPKGVPHE